MRKLRVGIVGLGGIAQKVYLPILSQAKHWELMGAYTPNQEKNCLLCQQYRIVSFFSLDELAANCDVAFVHSTTAAHYEIAEHLLRKGLHVYIDKPLAETLDQAEALVELAEKQQRTLMVGFNRRFAPFYQTVKAQMPCAAAVRFEKHRIHGISNPLRFTMYDDYLHLLDTVLWLCDGELSLQTAQINKTTLNELIFAGHVFRHDNKLITTAMHRDAGTQAETLEVITHGAVMRVRDLNRLEEERDGKICVSTAGSWQTILELRGFVPMVEHFLDCVANQTTPKISSSSVVLLICAVCSDSSPSHSHSTVSSRCR